jgi:hypothetical protein
VIGPRALSSDFKSDPSMIKRRTRPQIRKRETSLEAQDVSEDEDDEKLPYVMFRNFTNYSELNY